MFKQILVPLDGGTLAERALPVAARIARASGGSIILLRVVSPPVEYGYWNYSMPTATMTLGGLADADIDNATNYLKGLAESSDLAGVHTSIEVHSGPAAMVIFNVTQSLHVDLIVMSSHGDTGLKRWVLGSVSQKVARHSPVPVLVLRRGQETLSKETHPLPYIERPMRILVPLDGSALAKEALIPAAQLIAAIAAPGQAAMHLVRVIKLQPLHGGQELDPTTKEHMLQRSKKYLGSITEHLKGGIAAQLKLMVTWSVAIDADAASAIIRVAENGEDAEGSGVFGGCDVIAMATHGRGGMQRWAMGSITERVLQGTKLPLLIVRAQNKTGEIEVNEEEAITLV